LSRSAPVRFVHGALYLVRGARALFAMRSEVGHLILIPLLLGAAASGLGAIELLHRGLSGLLLGVAAALGGFLFTAAYTFLSGPLSDRISERVERSRLGDAVPKASVLALLFDVLHDVPRIAAYLASLAVAWLAARLYAPILPLASYFLTAGYLAYNAIDYSMARRGLSRGAKRKLLAGQRALVLGLGAAEAALALVPIANLLIPSLGAAAGTLLYLDELAEPAQNRRAEA